MGTTHPRTRVFGCIQGCLIKDERASTNARSQCPLWNGIRGGGVQASPFFLGFAPIWKNEKFLSRRPITIVLAYAITISRATAILNFLAIDDSAVSVRVRSSIQCPESRTSESLSVPFSEVPVLISNETLFKGKYSLLFRRRATGWPCSKMHRSLPGVYAMFTAEHTRRLKLGWQGLACNSVESPTRMPPANFVLSPTTSMPTMDFRPVRLSVSIPRAAQILFMVASSSSFATAPLIRRTTSPSRSILSSATSSAASWAALSRETSSSSSATTRAPVNPRNPPPTLPTRLHKPC